MDLDMVKSLNSIMSEFECKWNSPACNIITEYLSIQSGDWAIHRIWNGIYISLAPRISINVFKTGRISN